jgi:hypothetical protein
MIEEIMATLVRDSGLASGCPSDAGAVDAVAQQGCEPPRATDGSGPAGTTGVSAMVPQVRHHVVAPFLAWLDTHVDSATVRVLRPVVPRVLACWRVFLHVDTAGECAGRHVLADWLAADRNPDSDAVITTAFTDWTRTSLRHHPSVEVTVLPHTAAILRLWFDYLDAITTHTLTESPQPLPLPAPLAPVADPAQKARPVPTCHTDDPASPEIAEIPETGADGPETLQRLREAILRGEGYHYRLHIDFAAASDRGALRIAAVLAEALGILRDDVHAYSAAVSLGARTVPVFCLAEGPGEAICDLIRDHGGWHVALGPGGMRWGEGDSTPTRPYG